MFSDKEAQIIEDNSEELWGFIEDLHYDVLDEFKLSAIIVMRCHTQYSCDLLSCINIDRSPLESGEKQLIFNLLDECIKYHKKPHVHMIDDQLLKRINPIVKDKKSASSKVIFLPFVLAEEPYVVLCLQEDGTLGAIPDGLDDRIAEMVLLSKKISDTDGLIGRLHALEQYVKEVGHDFASSVQSTVPKLHNLAKGRYGGKMAIDKAKEAESEIWSAYRHASNLGLVVDPKYSIKAGDHFDFVSVVQDVLNQYESEAKERHIVFSVDYDNSSMSVWGDEEAVATALSHYLLNAMKYSFGSSTIRIIVNDLGNDVDFKIRNKGIPLRKGESIKIWKCGERGRDAYERHVNGCGIGLYTVKKIVDGHGGFVNSRTLDTQYVEFSLRIPKDKRFSKKVL